MRITLGIHIVVASILLCHASIAQVIRGYTGTQVFNNCGNSGEQELCGINATMPVWLTFIPETAGVLYLNTDGSDFNTIMGVFVRSPSNPSILQLVACDNNGGADGIDSALHLRVRAGETNFIMLASADGRCGTIVFNFSLVAPSTLTPLGFSPSGQFRGRVTGREQMRFTIEVSSDLISWTSLQTTTSPTATYDFVDTTSPTPRTRFYRALMLPW